MMKRLYSIIALVLAFALSLPHPAYAEDLSPKGKNWHVTFTAKKKMVSNFDGEDFNDILKNLQPGDELTVKVNIKNSNKKKTDWYMSNEVLKSLEDQSKTAEGGAYSYKLVYTNSKGKDRVLYDSETVGGEDEDIPEDLQGLNEATDNLEDYFFLDTLNSGKGGQVSLRVALDGETQGNDYQDTMAQVRMNFAVELNEPGNNKKKKKSGTTAKTGDDNNMLLYFALAGVSGLVLAGLGGYSLKLRKKEEEED